MNVAITGPNGLIGSRVIKLLSDEITFIPLSHEDLDIAHKEDVENKLNDIEFDILLHLAAYTNVDNAELEQHKARAINVDGTRYLYDAVKQKGKKMIYISTDYVFDGVNPPFDEESVPNPIGYYGKTKYEGEQVLGNNAMIVRVSYPYHTDVILSGAKSQGKPDIVTRLSQLLKEGKTLPMVTDASITPTHIDDIAEGLNYLIHNFKPEIYHLVGSKSYSPFDVGTMIARYIGAPTDLIKPTTFEEYSKGKAPRPQYSETISKKNRFHKMQALGEVIEYKM
ncbi:MAG: SDR family oxidoreductase [bacterium]|nr:SDR family oxidoreductase [bacterium]